MKKLTVIMIPCVLLAQSSVKKDEISRICCVEKVEFRS